MKPSPSFPPRFDPDKLDSARWYYDTKAAERVIRFIERYVIHHYAQHENKPFLLLPWQKDYIRQFYGVKAVATGLDRYRYGYIESGKGTGKSPLAAALGLYHLSAHHDAKPLVQNMAATYEQADELFGLAKLTVDASPALSAGIGYVQRLMRCPERGGRWKIGSGTKKGKSGAMPSLVIVDELHEFDGKDGDFLAYIEGNLPKRANSKMLIITNAGTDLQTPCGKWHDRAVAIQNGERFEEDVLPLVLAADPDDDISLPETWLKANPSIGHTVTFDDYRRAYQRTIGNKAQEIVFRRLWLTQWTRSDKQWLKPENINACVLREIDPDRPGKTRYMKELPAEVRALPHWGGFDLGPTDDITAYLRAFCDVANDVIYVEAKNWLPRPAAEDFKISNGIPYDEWQPDYIELLNCRTLGAKEKKGIAESIVATSPEAPQMFVADKFAASEVVNAVIEAGWTVEEISSSAFALNNATKDFEARVLSGRIRFLYNPCFIWQLSNAGLEVNSQELARPKRVGGPNDNPRKIDAVMALMYAIARAMLFMSAGGEASGVDLDYYESLHKQPP